MREEAVAVRLVEGRVIVTRFDFAPGAETGWHRHGDDGVIAAITDCQMRLEEPARARFRCRPAAPVAAMPGWGITGSMPARCRCASSGSG